MGHGDALDAVALTLGIEADDRPTFARVAHENFNALFPTENVSAEELMASINTMMMQHSELAKYSV